MVNVSPTHGTLGGTRPTNEGQRCDEHDVGMDLKWVRLGFYQGSGPLALASMGPSLLADRLP